MADVVVTISVSSVQYRDWLRTSYTAMSQVSEAGTPMIDMLELGPDQEDVFLDLMEESTREVLKLFSSRQGDVSGVPFEYDPTTDVIYRFNEGEPVLAHAASLKSQLNEDVKNALFSYVTAMWFDFKGNSDISGYYFSKFEKLATDIERNLYLLHD